MLAHARLTDKIVPGDPVVQAGLPAFMNPTSDAGVIALNGEVTRQAAMVAYDTIFAWMALGVVLLLPLLLLMRPAATAPTMAIEAHAD